MARVPGAAEEVAEQIADGVIWVDLVLLPDSDSG